jgi:transposase
MNTNERTENETHNKTKSENQPSKPAKPATGKSKRPQGVRGKPLEPTLLADRIKIGLDVGLNKYALCRQIDGSLPEAPRICTPEHFKEWLLGNKTRAKEVIVCYEAGLFGFELARWIIEQGMKCVVMAPVKLDEANKRVETDKLNARDICSRLDRYVSGNTRALTACRIPTRAEELTRHQTRQRQSLLDDRKALEAQGRSLLWQFGYLEEGKTCWWEEGAWARLQSIDPKVLGDLGRWRAVILEVNTQLKELVQELSQQVQDLPEPLRQAPTGAGWLSLLILTREIMNWERFNNRRQMGGFTGLVPSESSTGESVRHGSITKVGNPVVRTVLIEMAWRFVRYQPHCHAVKRWLPILRNKKPGGARARKKAIVAVARQLGVDLWRLATGQTTAAKLGLSVA